MTNCKLKVLLVSRNAWDDKKGNTHSVFFENFSKDELAQIYCRAEIPDTDLCDNFFHISERQLVKSIFSSNIAGRRVYNRDVDSCNSELAHANSEKKVYDLFRNYRFTLLLWIRELIWLFGKWKSKELERFILDFKPDIIYSDAYDTFYTYRVLKYAVKIAKVPYVLFHCDDQASYNQFSLNPLYWINRFMLRKHLRQAINRAAINYCIIDRQKEVYTSIFRKEFKILNKWADFGGSFTNYKPNKPLRLIYAGNLYHGRWKTLISIAKAIKRINENSTQVILDIYTGNTLSNKMLDKFNISKEVRVLGYLPYNDLLEEQTKADILLHVESFQLKEKLITHLSFSTKIVDFFALGKCILAIGWEKSGPIHYLDKHEAGITITKLADIEGKLTQIIENPKLLNSYASNAYRLGVKYHNKANQQHQFRQDLIDLAFCK